MNYSLQISALIFFERNLQSLSSVVVINSFDHDTHIYIYIYEETLFKNFKDWKLILSL